MTMDRDRYHCIDCDRLMVHTERQRRCNVCDAGIRHERFTRPALAARIYRRNNPLPDEPPNPAA